MRWMQKLTACFHVQNDIPRYTTATTVYHGYHINTNQINTNQNNSIQIKSKEGMKVRSYYWICDLCGAWLDVGERCDCSDTTKIEPAGGGSIFNNERTGDTMLPLAVLYQPIRAFHPKPPAVFAIDATSGTHQKER